MSKPTPKTADQELAEAEQLATRAAKEFALKKADADVANELGPLFLEGLQVFETFIRKNNVPPERALVMAAAVHASVETRLLAKCGTQMSDTVEEMQRVADLHNDVHKLSLQGRGLERRMVTKGVVVADGTVVGGPATGVGEMVLSVDDAKGT